MLVNSPDPEHKRAELGGNFPASSAGSSEREKRFELSTLALARRCSTAELFPRIQNAFRQHRKGELPVACQSVKRFSAPSDLSDPVC